MKHVPKAIIIISIFLHAHGLYAQDDFISALRLDHWASGTLVLKDGQTISGKINYDYANHFVQIEKGDSIQLFNEKLASTLHFDWFDSPDKATFRNLKMEGLERMYRVLFENEQLAFLSYYETDIKTSGPLASSERPKGIVLKQRVAIDKDTEDKRLYLHSWKERFIVVTANGEIRELGTYFILPANNKGQVLQGALMTRKGLLRKLRDLHPTVKSILDNKALDLDNRHHIMQVFKEVVDSMH